MQNPVWGVSPWVGGQGAAGGMANYQQVYGQQQINPASLTPAQLQQWQQWQQQYQAWQQQYGQKYEESLKAMGQGASAPPLPVAVEQQAPPLPPEDSKPPLPVAGPEKNPPLPTEPLEELSEAEKNFDVQFKQWEEQFEQWKKQNGEHPDKTQYRQYESKWESWREQLLERREQMRKKRLAAMSPTPATIPVPQKGSTPALPPEPEPNKPMEPPPPVDPYNDKPLTFKKQPSHFVKPENDVNSKSELLPAENPKAGNEFNWFNLPPNATPEQRQMLMAQMQQNQTNFNQFQGYFNQPQGNFNPNMNQQLGNFNPEQGNFMEHRRSPDRPRSPAEADGSFPPAFVTNAACKNPIETERRRRGRDRDQERRHSRDRSRGSGDLDGGRRCSMSPGMQQGPMPGGFNQGNCMPFNQGPGFQGMNMGMNMGMGGCFMPGFGPGTFAMGGFPGNFGFGQGMNHGPGPFNCGPGNFNGGPAGPCNFSNGPGGPGNFINGPGGPGGPGNFIGGPGNFNNGPDGPGNFNCGPGNFMGGPGNFNNGPDGLGASDCGPGNFNDGRGGPFNSSDGPGGPGNLVGGPGNFQDGDHPKNINEGSRSPGSFRRGPGSDLSDANRGSGNFDGPRNCKDDLRGQGILSDVPMDLEGGTRGLESSFGNGPRGHGNVEVGPRGPGNFGDDPRGSGFFSDGPNDTFNDGPKGPRNSSDGPRGPGPFNEGLRGSGNFGHGPRGPGNFDGPERPGPFNEGPRGRDNVRDRDRGKGVRGRNRDFDQRSHDSNDGPRGPRNPMGDFPGAERNRLGNFPDFPDSMRGEQGPWDIPGLGRPGPNEVPLRNFEEERGSDVFGARDGPDGPRGNIRSLSPKKTNRLVGLMDVKIDKCGPIDKFAHDGGQLRNPNPWDRQGPGPQNKSKAWEKYEKDDYYDDPFEEKEEEKAPRPWDEQQQRFSEVYHGDSGLSLGRELRDREIIGRDFRGPGQINSDFRGPGPNERNLRGVGPNEQNFRVPGMNELNFRGFGPNDPNLRGPGLDEPNARGRGPNDSDFRGHGVKEENFRRLGSHDENFRGPGPNDANFRETGLNDANFRDTGPNTPNFLGSGMSEQNFRGPGLNEPGFRGPAMNEPNFRSPNERNFRGPGPNEPGMCGPGIRDLDSNPGPSDPKFRGRFDGRGFPVPSDVNIAGPRQDDPGQLSGLVGSILAKLGVQSRQGLQLQPSPGPDPLRSPQQQPLASPLLKPSLAPYGEPPGFRGRNELPKAEEPEWKPEVFDYSGMKKKDDEVVAFETVKDYGHGSFQPQSYDYGHGGHGGTKKFDYGHGGDRGRKTFDYGHGGGRADVFDYSHGDSKSPSVADVFLEKHTSRERSDSSFTRDRFGSSPSAQRQLSALPDPGTSVQAEMSPVKKTMPDLSEQQESDKDRSRDRPWDSKQRDRGEWNRDRNTRDREKSPGRRRSPRQRSRSPQRPRSPRQRSRSPRRPGRKDDKEDTRKQTDVKPETKTEPVANVVVPASKNSVSSVLMEDLIHNPGRSSRPLKIVFILRGIAGSGKSYVTRLIKEKEIELGGSAPRILSLDDYFMTDTEEEIRDAETGQKVKKKVMKYEYDADMEDIYQTALVKAFKKTLSDGFFHFIIVDSVNKTLKQVEEMWSFARLKGFQVYVCEMDNDVAACFKRNIHNRTEADVENQAKGWQPSPSHYLRLDVRSLLQSEAIEDVEMEDVEEEPAPTSAAMATDKSKEEEEDVPAISHFLKSKWDDVESSGQKLDRLDGLKKKKPAETSMEEYLCSDFILPERERAPGKKRVRWADMEERGRQEKMRAIGFVVGQTDWKRMMDPSYGDSALTRTKYF